MPSLIYELQKLICVSSKVLLNGCGHVSDASHHALELLVVTEEIKIVAALLLEVDHRFLSIVEREQFNSDQNGC